MNLMAQGGFIDDSTVSVAPLSTQPVPVGVISTSILRAKAFTRINSSQNMVPMGFRGQGSDFRRTAAASLNPSNL